MRPPARKWFDTSPPESTRRRREWARSGAKFARRLGSALVVTALLILGGCVATSNELVSLPARNSIESDQLIVLSDFRIPSTSPLIGDLKQLRQQVCTTLDLPYSSRPVTVYLFKDELTYTQYIRTTYPKLPERRAYFVKKTPGDELAVYTSWGEQIQEDLRHEFTHGLLHAALQTPPLWLDEGLAEYFEVPGLQVGGVNRNDASRLTQGLADGWRPNIHRLEGLTEVDKMSRADYREAWAWVHFMLHSSPETRQVLLTYLHDLRTSKNPSPLSKRLMAAIPNATERMSSYIATLPVTGAPMSGSTILPASASVMPTGAQ